MNAIVKNSDIARIHGTVRHRVSFEDCSFNAEGAFTCDNTGDAWNVTYVGGDRVLQSRLNNEYSAQHSARDVFAWLRLDFDDVTISSIDRYSDEYEVLNTLRANI